MPKVASLSTTAEALTNTQVARFIALQLLSMITLFPREALVAGCVTAAATLTVGRPLNANDEAVVTITADFISKLQDLRTVLREDATTMAAEPKKVM